MPRIYSSWVNLILTVVIAAIVTSCSSRNTGEQVSSNPPGTPQTSPAPVKKGFDADLEYVRKGQYTYVLVFSRKDGKPIDRDDSAYLRTNAPQVVDWVTSEEGKKVIAGTNFDLEKGNLNLMRKRFVVEDYSLK